MDDAGVFRISDDLALVQTVDFFPPIVDDPFQYGRISAVNSLSDIYAMGAIPLTVLQVVGFPKDEVPLDVLSEILQGGAEAIRESGAALLGGHSVIDQEVKYGLSVTGSVHPDRILTNSNVHPGDLIYLTKQLGMGVIATAHKKEKVGPEVIEMACRLMGTLNKAAADAMLEAGAMAATDVTGFGLLGHASEMARGGNVTLQIDAERLPLFPGALALAAAGVLSGGSARTRDYLADEVHFAAQVDRPLQDLMFDAETSGGLLIAIREDRAAKLEEELRSREVPIHRIGRVLEKGSHLLEVC